jgi:hypothetical protein
LYIFINGRILGGQLEDSMTEDKKRSSVLPILAGLVVLTVVIFAALSGLRTTAVSPNAPPDATTFQAALDCADCEAEGIDVNLWDSPSRNEAVGRLPSGTRVTVLDRRVDESGSAYYLVTSGDQRGWVAGHFLNIDN